MYLTNTLIKGRVKRCTPIPCPTHSRPWPTPRAAPFEVSLPAISRHLKVLESADLIVREKDAQWRRCRIQAAALRVAADWVQQYREFWEDRLDALGDYLENQQNQEEASDDTDTGNGGSRRRKRRRNEH